MNNAEYNQGGSEIVKGIKIVALAAIGALAIKFLPDVLDSEVVESFLQDPTVR